MKIYYVGGYKYQLRETFTIQTDIHPLNDIHAPLVSLFKTGFLVIQPYFAWDGCSGPTYDDRTNMRAGLVHDALYYLMRSKLLSICWRRKADCLLEKIMIEDGAWKLRARYYRWAVEKFAERCAMPGNGRGIEIAP